MPEWNPWHGCKRWSEGCLNCYVYRRDGSVGRDASIVTKNGTFRDIIAKKRDGSWKIPDGIKLFACMTSDFFIDEADEWRAEVWEMIKMRPGIEFFIITKRITRAHLCLPDDWGAGYPNMSFCCTVENQKQADIRLPLFADFPAKRKLIVCEPLLGKIDLEKYLSGIDCVSVGGESGPNARICDYSWVLDIRAQCIRQDVPFNFRQTGAHFMKDGKKYFVKRALQHAQARKAGIDTDGSSVI